VDTLEGLSDMLAELKSAKEIAVDLEHHDVHSYHGLVSLMQISTREKDWVVDTLKPWREELQVLNEVFADPNILKVLHGSSMDIIWLQRDLGLYVVGMFDTYHASSALNYRKKSLKFLLEKFVNLQVDKRYQMADWRVRPLPSSMFDYARSDTHYLLYIYDHLRNELIQNSTPENNLIDYVLEQSKAEALQRYERPVYDAETGQGPGGWYDYLSRNPAVLSREQFAVFKAVHQWRDQVARQEDEGVQCVLPKHVLFKIAQVMPLDLGTLFRTLSPVTPIVKARASDLLEVIKAAKIAGANGPEWRDVVRPKPTKQAPPTPDGVHIEQGLLTPPGPKEGFPTASRCEVSQFWGAVLDQREPPTPPEYSAVACAEALRLSLPLPPMPMTVSEARDKLGGSTTTKPAPTPTPAAPVETPKDKDNNDIFTVKEIGGARKRKIAQADKGETSQSAGSDGDESPDSDPEEQPSKKQRQKKKDTSSTQERPKSQGKGRDQDTTPFDYTTAESVLHAQPSETAGGPPSKTSMPFNPYAKALDAPQALRKPKKETSGKTFTFRK